MKKLLYSFLLISNVIFCPGTLSYGDPKGAPNTQSTRIPPIDFDSRRIADEDTQSDSNSSIGFDSLLTGDEDTQSDSNSSIGFNSLRIAAQNTQQPRLRPISLDDIYIQHPGIQSDRILPTERTIKSVLTLNPYQGENDPLKDESLQEKLDTAEQNKNKNKTNYLINESNLTLSPEEKDIINNKLRIIHNRYNRKRTFLPPETFAGYRDELIEDVLKKRYSKLDKNNQNLREQIVNQDKNRMPNAAVSSQPVRKRVVGFAPDEQLAALHLYSKDEQLAEHPVHPKNMTNLKQKEYLEEKLKELSFEPDKYIYYLKILDPKQIKLIDPPIFASTVTQTILEKLFEKPEIFEKMSKEQCYAINPELFKHIPHELIEEFTEKTSRVIPYFNQQQLDNLLWHNVT